MGEFQTAPLRSYREDLRKMLVQPKEHLVASGVYLSNIALAIP